MTTERYVRLAWVAVPLAVLALASPTADHAPGPSTVAAPAEAALAIPFVENLDSADGARFTARTFAGAVHVTGEGDLVYVLPPGAGSAPGSSVVLRERLETEAPQWASAGASSPTRISVFRGSDPASWRTGMPTCESVSITSDRGGVGLELRARAQNVEKVFTVPAGSDPADVRMRVDGADSVTLSPAGELELGTAFGPMTFTAPVAYQDTRAGRVHLDVTYVVDGNHYGFDVRGHDPGLPLVIDPLIAATYLGSEGNDWAYDVEVHPELGVYVAGSTDSAAFPTTPSAYDTEHDGGRDAFIALLSHDLMTLQACTFIGGSGEDQAFAVSVGHRGVWAGGRTGSTSDFPTTKGVVFPTSPGGTSDGWVARLDLDLMTLEASTYYGGSGGDEVKDVVAAGGALYLAGETRSDDLWFPDRAMQKVRAGSIDCFFTTMHENLEQVSFQTLFGGSSSDSVARIEPGEGTVLACGDTYSRDFPVKAGAYSTSVQGEGDCWVAMLFEDYHDSIGCTYLGGAAMMSEMESATDVGWAMGSIYVTGYTNAETFPTTKNAFQTTFSNDYDTEGFVTCFDEDLTALVASTLIGGSGVDEVSAMHLTYGGVFITGYTNSEDFPAVSGGNDTTYNGSRDAFVAAFPGDLSALLGSTYLGGPSNESGEAIWVDRDTIYVAGICRGPDFPTTPGAYDQDYNAYGLRTDAFVAALTLDEGGPPPTEVDAYILPKKLNVKRKAPADKSKLFSLGVFDTGAAEIVWGGPATLSVGDVDFTFTDLPINRRGVYTYETKGVRMKIKPAKSGSSKAKFNLKIKDASVADIPLDEPLTVRFRVGELDGSGTVLLRKGRYRIGRRRGALIGPHICLFNCRAKFLGDGKDWMFLRIGLATGAGTPEEAPDVTITVGGLFSQTIPSAAFVRKKEAYVFKSKTPGLKLLKLDYGKEKLLLRAEKMEFGDGLEGAHPMRVMVQIGDDPPYAINVRMVRPNKKLKY